MTTSVDSSASRRLVLVNMPWHDLDRPSLAQGLLVAVARRERPQWESSQVNANMLLVGHLQDRGIDFGIGDYALIADNLVWDLIGDWLFTPAAFPAAAVRSSENIRNLCREKGLSYSMLARVRDEIPAYCDEVAGQIVRTAPDVVGFTTTFMQSVASLAVAHRVKELLPDCLIVFGGANCESEMGEALLRNCPVIDIAVSGAGEHALLDLLDAVESGSAHALKPGSLVSSDKAVELELLPAPDYDDYFRQLDETTLADQLDVRLVVEASRGCWWGEIRHCTFCGINGADMQYRNKSFERFTAELDAVTARHKTRRLAMNDNIMPVAWAPRLAEWAMETGTEYEMFWEIKSSLDYVQIAHLAAAGCTLVQPGIESLSNDALRAMRKGVTATQNVALLVAASSTGVDVAWSQLYGFPGESLSWYHGMLSQAWRLFHLQPPNGAVRILLERFSPNFTDPELGFRASAKPHSAFREVFPAIPESELFDLAFMFDSESQGLTEAEAGALSAMTGAWAVAHSEAKVSLRSAGGEWHVVEHRPHIGVSKVHSLTPDAVELLDYLRRPSGRDGIERWGGDRALDLVDQFDELGLVFSDGRAYVSVVEFGERLLTDLSRATAANLEELSHV